MNSFIQYIFISIVLIIIGHNIFNFLIEKYTIKKVKNMGNIQRNKYKQLFDELEDKIKNGQNNENINTYLDEEHKINMIHELTTYMTTL